MNSILMHNSRQRFSCVSTFCIAARTNMHALQLSGVPSTLRYRCRWPDLYSHLGQVSERMRLYVLNSSASTRGSCPIDIIQVNILRCSQPHLPRTDYNEGTYLEESILVTNNRPVTRTKRFNDLSLLIRESNYACNHIRVSVNSVNSVVFHSHLVFSQARFRIVCPRFVFII